MQMKVAESEFVNMTVGKTFPGGRWVTASCDIWAGQSSKWVWHMLAHGTQRCEEQHALPFNKMTSGWVQPGKRPVASFRWKTLKKCELVHWNYFPQMYNASHFIWHQNSFATRSFTSEPWFRNSDADADGLFLPAHIRSQLSINSGLKPLRQWDTLQAAAATTWPTFKVFLPKVQSLPNHDPLSLNPTASPPWCEYIPHAPV